MTQKERIATLLTGLDLTIEIAETILTTSLDDIETLKKAVTDLASMKKYAASERDRLNAEREEGQS